MQRPTTFKSGNKNWNWKGGRNVNSRGYIMVYLPQHPANIRKYVYEHRLIMEKHLGRFLRSDEIVYHLNKNKLDNRLENLWLGTRQARPRF